VKYAALCLMSVFLFPMFLTAQTGGEAESLLEQINDAVEMDFFDRALELMDQGSSEYPGDYRFARAKGDLYFTRELYSMALDSYRSAEELNPYDRDLRKSIASVLGYLDLNFQALDYLEVLYSEGEDSLLDDLGWMYYKTHQPEKGVLLIRKALDSEFDRNLSLTLGTLYSELNDPLLCRQYYLEAIRDALRDGDVYFASVGYYNLSLAEKSFYDYEAAFDYASRSLDLMDRAGGHLALSDLYLLKENFQASEEELLKAVDLDETPLARSNLVSLYIETGQLFQALRELRRIEENQDDSWMYYYGLNRNQFLLDLYNQYYQVFKGLAGSTGLIREWGVRNRLKRLADGTSFRLKAFYYKILYRSLAFREGKSQKEGGSLLRGALTLAEASEGFASASGKFYRTAQSLEGFSRAAPWYDLVLGREFKDTGRLESASRSFDPVWEIQPMDESLRERALLTRSGKSGEYDPLVADLYSRNPGGLLQYGLRLPLVLDVSGTGQPGLERRLRRFLKMSGFILRDASPDALILRVRASDTLQYVLSTREGKVYLSGSDSEATVSRESLISWMRTFRNAVFLP